MSSTERIIILVDMDCFYCQVEEKLDARLEGKPIAVVQYNAWRGGGIIAVNYSARDKGVTRHMRGNEAKEKCPEIELVRVPEVRGKADLTKYRDAGKKVADVLQTFTLLLERASVDEAYLDVTEAVNKQIATGLDSLKIENMQNTFVVGSDTNQFLQNVTLNREFMESNLKLAVGGLIAEEIRCEVYNKTGYRCSAGIAHNKILAKLVCGLHKPNKQTILPQEAIPELFETMPLRKIKSLGGKFGNTLAEELGITYMGQLRNFTEKELIQKFDEKTAIWLYKIARGIDLEPVTSRLVSKSIGCCKKFPGKTALIAADSVEHWLNEFASEISERLEKDLEENNRKAKQMVISFVQEIGKKDVSSSRTHPLNSYNQKKIAQSALEVVKKFCLKSDGSFHLKYLGISVTNFEDIKGVREITSWFKVGNKMTAKKNCSETEVDHSLIVENIESNENQISDENASNYSATTEELDEDVDDLIFYDDNCRIKQTVALADDATSEDSINNEVIDGISSPIIQSTRSASCSFFRNYFYNSKPDATVEEDNKTTDEMQVPNSSPVNVLSYETCPDCNKKILESEFVSHLDYHYALKIVKEEAGNYKNRNQVKNKSPDKKSVKRKVLETDGRKEETESYKSRNQAKNKSSSKKSVKGKVLEGEGSNALLTFLRKDIEPDATEVCTECNKKLRLDEVACHMDYHAAKKLHLEINSNKSKVVEINNKVGKSVKKKKIPVKSVSSYFKPL